MNKERCICSYNEVEFFFFFFGKKKLISIYNKCDYVVELDIILCSVSLVHRLIQGRIGVFQVQTSQILCIIINIYEN